MSDTTPRLALPELAAAQAQKHVTVNEALIELDALCDCYLLSMALTAPPASPADGDAYLVASGGSGDWSGYDGKIAYCIDGAWRFYAPFNGLRACNAVDGKLYIYSGSTWTSDGVTLAGSQTLTNKTFSGATAFPDNGTWNASGNVGIGVSSPSGPLHINKTSGSGPVIFLNNTGGTSRVNTAGLSCYWNYTNGTQESELVFGGAPSSYLSIIHNSAGTYSERLRIAASGRIVIYGDLYPSAANTYYIGSSSYPIASGYTQTAWTVTSEAATKTNVRALSETTAAREITAAKALLRNGKIYQLIASVAEKGVDHARLHAGQVYEDALAVFVAAGLDPERYSIFRKTAAVETANNKEQAEFAEDGTPIYRKGLCYDELISFVLAGIAAELDESAAAVSALTARVAALEAKLA